MSTTAVVPPERSALLRGVPQVKDRAKAMLTPLNVHLAGLAALVLVVVYLVVHMVFVWQATSALDAAALDQARVKLRAAEIAAKPLRGLDTKLVDSSAAADKFYAQRLPYATSQVAAELGALTKREGVRLTRAQYAYNPVLSGKDALTEIRMDAGVAGDYRPIVQFINAVERDKTFFVINGIGLSGQQTGQVSLRIRMTTYLRAPEGDELMQELPVADAAKPGGTP
jgi:hypothetical protein